MQRSSRSHVWRSRLAGLWLAVRLLPASARLIWALARRPDGLSRAQWRAVRRAARADARAADHGAGLSPLLASAPDLATTIALAHAYWGCLGVGALFSED
jgi:hypothetical protein